MDPELRKACRNAGIKLCGGLLVVSGLVGVRVITAAPDGLEADLAELETLERALEAEARPPESAASDVPVEPSRIDRLTAARSSPASEGADPDRLVTCRIAGSTQFTRAADCLARGGSSKDIEARD